MCDLEQFINGQQDCRDGIPHRHGMPEYYDRGYSYQYHIEQISSERTDVQNSKRPQDPERAAK